MDVVLYNKSEYETKLKLKGIIKQFILSNFWYYVNPLLELSYDDNKHEINKIKFDPEQILNLKKSLIEYPRCFFRKRGVGTTFVEYTYDREIINNAKNQYVLCPEPNYFDNLHLSDFIDLDELTGYFFSHFNDTSLATLWSIKIKYIGEDYGNNVSFKRKFRHKKLEDLSLKLDFGHQNVLMSLITKFYPLDSDFIEKYNSYLEWHLLSGNPNINWTQELIANYENKWNWEILSSNDGVNWNDALIELFAENLNWKSISNNQSIIWSEEMLTKWQEKLDWKSLTWVAKLPWSESFYIKYYKYIYHPAARLSSKFTWSESFINSYKWDWQDVFTGLSGVSSLPWSEAFIKKHNEKINWEMLSENSGVPWTEKLIDKYYFKWDWQILSGNEGVRWSMQIIEKYNKLIDWKALSSNKSIPWSEELIERYLERWDWSELSFNSSLPFSDLLLEKYKERFVWGTQVNEAEQLKVNGMFCNSEYGLSLNQSIKWTTFNLVKFSNFINFKVISEQKNCEWSNNLIRLFLNNWDWKEISKNISIPWSINFIEEHLSRLSKDDLALNKGVYDKLLQGLSLPEVTTLVDAFVDRFKFYQSINYNENIASGFDESSFLRRKIFSDIISVSKNTELCVAFDLKEYTKSIYDFISSHTENEGYSLRAAQNVPNIIKQFITYSQGGNNILTQLGIDKIKLGELSKRLLSNKYDIIRYLGIYGSESSKGHDVNGTINANDGRGFLFFDTETNGKAKNFNAPVTNLDNWPRIAQLGWQLYDSNQILINEGSYLVKPDGWKIPKEKFFIDNNMSTERCEKFGKPIEEVLKIFFNDISKSDYLIAHNMNFDINVLGAELIRANKKMPKDLIKICTMNESTNYCKLSGPYGYKWPTLTELHYKLFSIGFEGAHDALDDVKACAKSFFELKKRKVIDLKKFN